MKDGEVKGRGIKSLEPSHLDTALSRTRRKNPLFADIQMAGRKQAVRSKVRTETGCWSGWGWLPTARLPRRLPAKPGIQRREVVGGSTWPICNRPMFFQAAGPVACLSVWSAKKGGSKHKTGEQIGEQNSI